MPEWLHRGAVLKCVDAQWTVFIDGEPTSGPAIDDEVVVDGVHDIGGKPFISIDGWPEPDLWAAEAFRPLTRLEADARMIRSGIEFRHVEAVS